MVIMSLWLCLITLIPFIQANTNSVRPGGVVTSIPSTGYQNSYIPPDPSVCYVLDKTNAYRMRHGLPPLMGDSRLDMAAQEQCGIMRAVNKIDHDLGDGGPAARVTRVGYNWMGVAENLYDEEHFGGIDFFRAVKGWIDSLGHRKNILGDYTHLGVAHCVRGAKTWWVQVFGKGDVNPQFEYLSDRCFWPPPPVSYQQQPMVMEYPSSTTVAPPHYVMHQEPYYYYDDYPYGTPQYYEPYYVPQYVVPCPTPLLTRPI